MQVVEKHIGVWGRYQGLLYALVFIPGAISGCQTLLFTFTGAVPKHRCQMWPLDNRSSPIYSNPVVMGNETIPYLYPKSEKEGGKVVFCSYCQDHANNLSASLLDDSTENVNLSDSCNIKRAIECDDGHIYDRSQYHTSLAIKFDMVCEGHWRRDLAKSMFMVGKLLGSVIFGIISDVVGRRPVFLICSFAGIITFNVVPVLPSYWLICVFQIINGTVTYGAYLTAFVFVMEMIGGLYKTICGIMVQAFFTVGYIYVGVCAYFLRDWEHLQWAVSVPAILLIIIPYWWLIPESIRWLTVRGRIDDAEKIILRAAKWNKIAVNEEFLRVDLEKASKELQQQQLSDKRSNILHLFKYKHLAFNTLIVFFTWFAVAMTYYGLAYNADDLPGDDYTNFLLLGVAEIPGLIICIPIMEKFGRRIALISLMCAGGLSCIICAVIPENNGAAIVTFAMIGKATISGAFAVVYNYSAEIYPTVVRQQACGFSSLVGRIGSILAPQIHLLGKEVAFYVPLLIYGIVSTVAGVTDILLPETKGASMPDTIAEGAAFSKAHAPTASNICRRNRAIRPKQNGTQEGVGIETTI